MTVQFPIMSKTAKVVWDNFDRELVHKLKILPENERADIRLEILSHLYESTIDVSSSNSEPKESEEVKLINAISNLGSPDEYLEPLIADILLYQKTAKGNPAAILQSLKNSAKQGILHALATLVLGMGYFWVIMIFIMSVMHIFMPEVGIWQHSSGTLSLSFEAQPNALQWQTGWFSLIGIVASAAAYWLLNKALSFFMTKLKR